MLNISLTLAEEFTGLLFDCGGHPRVYIDKLGKFMSDPDFQEDVETEYGAGIPHQTGLCSKPRLVERLERQV